MDVKRDHAGCGEDVAPYALGALPPEEARAFERHLSGCELCRTDLDELRPIVAALPETVEQVPPPPDLRGRIMAVVEADVAARRRAERAERDAARPAPWWKRRRSPLPAFAAATALVLAGLGIGVALTGDDDVSTYQGTVASAAGADARLEVGDEGGRLVATGLPAPPRDRVYQVWLVRGEDAGPEPTTALFSPTGRGEASVDVPGDLDGVTQVLVSDEPVGGSPSPTTVPSIRIEL